MEPGLLLLNITLMSILQGSAVSSESLPCRSRTLEIMSTNFASSPATANKRIVPRGWEDPTSFHRAGQSLSFCRPTYPKNYQTTPQRSCRPADSARSSISAASIQTGYQHIPEAHPLAFLHDNTSSDRPVISTKLTIISTLVAKPSSTLPTNCRDAPNSPGRSSPSRLPLRNINFTKNSS